MEKSRKSIADLVPKNRKQLVFAYTFLFLITLVGAYFTFITLHRSLMKVEVDGLTQHYTWLIRLKHSISQLIQGGGFSFWSWNLGLGADTLGVFGGDYFDPFNYIAVLFPEQYIDVGYTVAIYLRLYVTGLGFLWFGKVVNLTLHSSLWGALAYSFSSWCFISSTRQATFVLIPVLFVFLMVGIEKILRRQSPLPFIICLFFFCARTLYFLYMSALLVIVYLLIYFVKNEQKTVRNFFWFFGRFLLYALIAVCLSAMIVIPAFYTLMHSVKTSSFHAPLFHTVEKYLNLITTFASGSEVFWQYSTFTTSALFLIPVVPIFTKIFRRKATSAMLTFFCCFIFLLSPFICSFFNGMSYVTGRWCYGMTFFYVWSGLQCLEDSEKDIIKLKKPIYIFLSFLGIWVTLICRVVLNINGEINALQGMVNVTVAFLAMYIIVNSVNQQRKRKSHILLTMLLIINLGIVYTVGCFPGLTSYINGYKEYGALYSKVMNSTQRAGLEIKDDTFYRIDQKDFITAKEAPEGYTNASERYVYIPANETLMLNTRSIYSFSSLNSGYLYDLNKQLCNNAGYYYRQCLYNNDNRTRLDFLTGVKYFLGNNPKNYPPTGADEFASYGFYQYAKSKKDVNILKTDYALGLGCAFDCYITEEEWNSLDYTEREHALMECVVIPVGSPIPDGLAHKDVKSISSGTRKLPFHIIKTADVSGEDGTDFQEEDFLKNKRFQVEKSHGGFTIKMDGNADDCEVYLTIRNLKRAIYTTKESDNMLGRIGNIRNFLKPAQNSVNFNIYARNGVISKRALNTIGSVSDFPDITDYTINMGVCNKGSDDIKISFSHMGEYTFDSIEVVAVPLDSFRECAQKCMDNSLKTDIINDNYVSGHLSTNQANSMLYVSIPYHDGWRAYVDGEETDIQRIDTAYSGVPIAGEGEHKIEFKFRPVGFTVGIFAFVIGVIGCVLIGVWHHKRKTE